MKNTCMNTHTQILLFRGNGMQGTAVAIFSLMKLKTLNCFEKPRVRDRFNQEIHPTSGMMKTSPHTLLWQKNNQNPST